MALAKHLLDRNETGVAEIAERVGYGSASTFQHGIQPARWQTAGPVCA